MSGSGDNNKVSGTIKTPADFLKSIRGRPVVVKLNSGVDYRGILACLAWVQVAVLFPSQTSMVFKEISLCILMIFAFKVSLSQQPHGKYASEVISCIPTSCAGR
ncbi:hypothetical protein Bca4012_066013 [Brassica carinata]|uniref:LSM domain-containing protein n=1 Tax=Brassica carinata TaxID=52824 RepID=A0A8X8B864_BRACI|nr:hypothetical protein Bca52824_007770 [Brassica carinata]